MSAVMETVLNDTAEQATPPADALPKAAEARRRVEVGADLKPAARKSALQPFVLAVLPAVLGLAFLALIWQIVSLKTASFPSPAATFNEAFNVFSDPF